MEDTIEVCSGCGKMPRAIDRMKGYFLCTRCGCRATIHVTSEDYERVVTELDQKFHQKIMKAKVAEVAKEPLGPASRNPKKKSRKKKARKPEKKAAKKKKVKKTRKKAKKRKR
jgi:hypothetical protein